MAFTEPIGWHFSIVQDSEGASEGERKQAKISKGKRRQAKANERNESKTEEAHKKKNGPH